MKKTLTMLLLLTGIITSGCYVSGGGGYYPDRVQSFIDLLNAQSAYDSHFSLVKHPSQTATEGFVVVYSADTGYVAYDIDSYVIGDSWSTYSAYADYQEVYIDYTYTDAWGEVFYVGDAFYNDIWGDYAGEFVFEQSEENFKDLEKLTALKQAFKVAKLGETFVSDFGLEEGRAEKVAKMVVEWEKVSKTRELTNADADAFTKELLGVNINDAEAAYKKFVEGDEAAMKDLISKAAEANGTSPEHMGSLISDFITNQ